MSAAGPVVGLNLLYLLPGVVGGTETYARELLHALARVPSDFRFRVFVNREAEGWPLPEGFERVVCPVHATSRAARYRWEQLALPREIKRRPVALLHSLGYTGPVRVGAPAVVTVHDLNFVRHPGMAPVRRLALRTIVGLAARRAARVITVSSFSRREIVEGLRIPEARVVVTRLAAEFDEPPTTAAVRAVRARYRLEAPYLLAFGSSEVHKNIDGLVRAFASVSGALPHDLVLAGHLAPTTLAAVPAELAARVRSTGWVGAADLPPLIAGADGLIVPSFYEGFGLPVLNAQALGVPVAASNAGSLPEVGGSAALWFDPGSTAQMAEAIRTLVAPAEREQRARAGRANAARYDWLDTARATLGVYDGVLAASGAKAEVAA